MLAKAIKRSTSLNENVTHNVLANNDRKNNK